MSTISTSLQIKGLGKQKMAAVMARAKGLGMSPERYLKHLLEEDLAVSERAKSSSFEEILGAGRAADEGEIDQLVEEAKARHHRRPPRSSVARAAK
jgi:hypothetical protein